jgi:hypothetical protein
MNSTSFCQRYLGTAKVKEIDRGGFFCLFLGPKARVNPIARVNLTSHLYGYFDQKGDHILAIPCYLSE